MKKIFFTSDTKHYHTAAGKKIANTLDNTNEIVDQLKELIDSNESILFISSDASDYESIDEYSKLLFDGLKCSEIVFDEYLVLDDRTINAASDYIKKANVIFLSGGDTYVQNSFFQKIDLKELLKDYNGVIIGQSAGSINLAKNVYNSPEEGNLSEPIYFDGLGLSNINIEPHFNLDTTGFNELQMYQRNHQLEESKRRPIIALCDGSHILETDKSITVYGKSYLIQDGIIESICNDKESYNIPTNYENNTLKV